MSRFYLTLEIVIAIHDAQIQENGGKPGILNPGAIESALARPQNGYYKDILEEAAAYLESLTNNHGFVDGNKRVGFFSTDTFLRINGLYINCDNDTAFEHFDSLFESQQFKFENLLSWLRENVKTLSS